MAQEASITPPRAAGPRPRLHLVYFALAAFDLLTVSLGLYLIDRVTRIHADSLTVNQTWAERLADYAELSRLAAAVNAPGNDVFFTRDVDAEAARLTAAVSRFEAKAAAVREDLGRIPDDEDRRRLLAAYDATVTAMADMVDEAEGIFTHFRGGEPLRAGERMAQMDRAYAVVNTALAELAARVRAIQESHFSAQVARAASLRKFEFVIAGLIVVMVVAVTLYGHRLARRMKQTARETEANLEALRRSRAELARHRDHLEELVAERTAELRASNDRLRLAERLASIGTLAAGLGHDMNNVLFPVRCGLDALEAGASEEAAREEIGRLRRSVRYLQRLSDGLRLLSLDPEDPHPASATTDPGAWIREAGPLFRSALPRGATLHCDVPSDLPALAVAPHRLTQAIFNLVVNAGEAISETGTVRVAARRTDDGKAVRIEVADDGRGMPEAVRKRALDPFFTTKTRHLSTGLGLALVHGVAGAAGGAVDIDSTPGRGTTVALTLPCADGGNGKAATSLRRATVSVTDRRRAAYVSALLASAGCNVTHERAPAGDSALWVAEPSAAPGPTVTRFLAGAAGRRVILLGADGGAATEPGVTVVEGAERLDSIQRAIDEALSTRPEASS